MARQIAELASTAEILLKPLEHLIASSLSSFQERTPEGVSETPLARPLHEAEQRAKSRLHPLVQYYAPDTYEVVSPQEGDLHLVPDSTEWFDWLATLSTFRFIGKQGSPFTAYREAASRSWSARRTFQKQHLRHYLGVTNCLTIALLEEAATRIQDKIGTAQ